MLPRDELVDRVVGCARDKRLVLVTAPSGFGKTTLLSAVFRRLERSGGQAIWLSAADVDRDPVSLDRILLEQMAQRRNRPPQEGESFLTYAEKVCGRHPVTIFIDNWNFIETDATNRYFDRVLEGAGDVIHFVVGSRRRPGFLFETYLLDDNLASFGVNELGFTPAEALAFIELHAPDHLSESTKALLEKTEGWPAGLQLLRLALQQTSASAVAELRFSGSRSDVAEYLNKSLFSQLPSSQRSFLCNLSLLDQLDRGLVAHVIGSQAAGVEFDTLARDNVFLMETRDGSQRYRFHSLFRDFLLSQRDIETVTPAEELLRRAAEWHEKHNETNLAIAYALRGQDAPHALLLLEGYAERRLVPEGNIFRFAEWISELKSLGGMPSPLLEYWHQWSLVFSGRWSLAQSIKQANAPGEISLIDAIIGAFADDQKSLRSAIEKWTNNGGSGDPFSVAVMRAAAGVAALARGEPNNAVQCVLRAKFAVEQTESVFGRIWVAILLALAALFRGRCDEAVAETDHALDLLKRTSSASAGIGRIVHLVASINFFLRGEEGPALYALRLADMAEADHNLPIIEIWAEQVARSLGVHCRSKDIKLKGRSPSSALLDEAFKLDESMRIARDNEKMRAQFEAFEAKVNSAICDDPLLPSQNWALRDAMLALNCRVMIASGRHDAASRILGQAIVECQRSGGGLAQQKLALLRVAALVGQGKQAAALRLLIQTAETAVRSRLFRGFRDEKGLIGALYPALIDAGERAPLGNDAEAWRALVDFIGEGATQAAAPGRDASTDQEQIRPSSKELDMLRFLDAGLSNREIGERLGITIPTVKWYLHNLFSKIGVKNRSSAVRFARDQRLI